MVYYNLKVVVMLKRDILHLETYQKISDFIAYAMLQDDVTKNLHETNCYKMYNFCSLYPLEKDGIYKCGNMYSFDVKFVDLNLVMKIKQFLTVITNSCFKVVIADIKVYRYKKITKLISLTPCIITTKKGDYKVDNDIELIKNRIISGVEKKYQLIYKEKMKADFIQDIIKTNRTPIKIPYKNIHFLGNKFEIIVKDDELSQKFAHISLATGILEKNSQGFRFL